MLETLILLIVLSYNNGAIWSNGTLTILGSDFTNIDGFGGVICNYGSIVAIGNFSFINNSALASGGAIYNYDTNLTISNSNFTSNNATNGTVINMNGSGLHTINNSNIINNGSLAGNQVIGFYNTTNSYTLLIMVWLMLLLVVRWFYYCRCT